MTVGYARVSSKDQEVERQIKAIKQYRPNIPDENIFKDKISGKTFDRPEYKKLKDIISFAAKNAAEPIELVIEEFDRLGRNKEQIKQELAWFKQQGVIVRILNLPTTLIDLSEDTNIFLDMIQNLLIEVLGTIAETELQFREKRQAEGIAVAKTKGVYKGRKPIAVNEKQFEDIYKRWRSGSLKSNEAMELLKLKPNTFYRRVKQYEEDENRDDSKE